MTIEDRKQKDLTEKSPTVKKTRTGDLKATVYLDVHNDHPIKLTVSASPANWERLEKYSAEDAEGFAWDFRETVVWAVLGQIKTGNEKKLRGKYKHQQYFVGLLKVRAGWLYAFLKYWSKVPLTEWPDYLIELLKKAEEEDYTIRIGKKIDSREFTSYCIEKAYGKLCGLHGLAIDNPENFYITYIQDDRRPSKIEKYYLSGRNPEEIDKLGRTNVILKRVFSDLRIY